jgi:hypothetical protein
VATSDAPAVTDGGIALGHRFVDAIVAHDWDAVASCFTEDARFLAVVPQDKPFRERTGRDAAAGQLRKWFGAADVTELVTCDVEWMARRLRIAYRIHEHEPEGWFLVEQVAYATVRPHGFEDMNLACSGFLHVPA